MQDERTPTGPDRNLHAPAAASTSTLRNKFQDLYRLGDLGNLKQLYEEHVDVVHADVSLAFFTFAAFARANEIIPLEAVYRQLLADNGNNSAVMYKLMMHQRAIRNTARFYDLMRDYATGIYGLDQLPWEWAAIFARVNQLAAGGKSQSPLEVLSALRSDQAPAEVWPHQYLRHRAAEEFFMFYENLRLLHGFGERFGRPTTASIHDELFWESIINRQQVSTELDRISSSGPNLFVQLHCPFNNLISRLFREYAKNSRAIGKSLYKGHDDGHKLNFQADKSSRLAVFVKAFKHLQVAKGSLMLAPDGATGGAYGLGQILGVPLKLYNGAANLAKVTKASSYLIHPSFGAAGIYIHLVPIANDDFQLSASEFDKLWRAKFSEAYSQVLTSRDDVRSLPYRFVFQ